MSEVVLTIVIINIILVVIATILTRFKVFSEARAMTAPIFRIDTNTSILHGSRDLISNRDNSPKRISPNGGTMQPPGTLPMFSE